MTLVLAILGAIPALYGIIMLIKKATESSQHEKVRQVIADTDKALQKAKETDDTSDLEDLINR